MKSRIRVAHVVHSFGTGGLEKGIATLAAHASRDIEHVVVCQARSGASSRLLPRGVRVIELHKPEGHSFRFLWALARSLKELEPDVVHTRNWTGMDGIVASHLAGVSSLVHGEHGWGMEDPTGDDFLRCQTRRLLCRGAREITCVSRQMIEWLIGVVGIERPITQIYNGVDTERFRPAESRGGPIDELGIAEGAFVVGTVGRLDPIKDHPTLFRAIERLRRSVPECELLVIGDGAERARLEKLATPHVRMLGDRQDVPDLLRRMDVFVLPSINEGISNTILEAMASGLPVVATRVGGNPELVIDGTTGRLVTIGDVEGIADALRSYAVDARFRTSHGRNARRRAVREFSVPGMVDAYEQIYRRNARS